MDRYNQTYTRRLKRKMFDVRISNLDSKNPYFNKLNDGKLGNQEVERDYAWFIKLLIETDEHTKMIRSEDQNEFENENENEDEDEDEDGDENEDEDDVDVNADENDVDPQYRMFLENLTEHGKAYKLKISQNDEEPCFLYYEEPNDSDWCDELQTCTDDSGDELTLSEDLETYQKPKMGLDKKSREIFTKKEVSRRKKINDHKSKTQPHQDFLNGCIPSEPVAVKSEENYEECEKNVTTSDTDSDVVILDNGQNCSEVNRKERVVAEKEPSLREKLLHILKQPYNEKEYEELSEYIEQKKPICRHLDLRGRSISSVYGGEEKSVLDDGPGSFRMVLNAAQNDPPIALNLLRMFRFWLEHVPNEDLFAPWRDKHFLKVRPSETKALNRPL